MTADWYPDPTGRYEDRYWDGSAWTNHVNAGGQPSTDPITGDYAPPQAQRAPVMTAPRQRRPVWPWVLVGMFALFLGGCALVVVAVGVGVNEAFNELSEEQERHAITKEEFDAVPIGASQQDVITILGKQPENVQEYVEEGVFDEDEIQTGGCIYYNRAGGEFGDRFQFCFDGNTLRSKRAY